MSARRAERNQYYGSSSRRLQGSRGRRPGPHRHPEDDSGRRVIHAGGRRHCTRRFDLARRASRAPPVQCCTRPRPPAIPVMVHARRESPIHAQLFHLTSFKTLKPHLVFYLHRFTPQMHG